MKGTAYVRAGGLRLRIARGGSGRPLLLITGIGANLDMWAPFARLVDDRELIAFDPPGAGLSERPRAPLRMKQLARVVRELMDVLAVDVTLPLPGFMKRAAAGMIVNNAMKQFKVYLEADGAP